MGVERPDLIETLVTEEIRRIVADAIGNGAILSASPAASEVLRIYPTCGLTERQLTDRIIMAASAAFVAVEIGEGPFAREVARQPTRVRSALGKNGLPSSRQPKDLPSLVAVRAAGATPSIPRTTTSRPERRERQKRPTS